MRIVSLVPAATEMAFALGAGESVVAVTHDDDYPPAVGALPRVTRSTIPERATAREIDNLVRAAAARGESTFHLDQAALTEARPDVILGQTLCAVCAVTLDRVPTVLDDPPLIVSLDASTIAGMLEDLRRVGLAIGRGEEADALVRQLARRLKDCRERVAGLPHPRVACLEWLDPLFNGGHWVPEQVEVAGGIDVLGRARERSREISPAELRDARPDIVIAMPCGWGAERAAREANALTGLGRARVVGVDGAAFFSRPGPRLVDGAELLASILHPEVAAPPEGALAIEVAARA